MTGSRSSPRLVEETGSRSREHASIEGRNERARNGLRDRVARPTERRVTIMERAPRVDYRRNVRATRSPETTCEERHRNDGMLLRMILPLLCIAALEYSQLFHHGNLTSPRILVEALLTLSTDSVESTF